MKAGMTFALACALGGLVASPGGGQAATIFGLIDTGEVHASSDLGRTWTLRSTLPVHDAVSVAAAAAATDLVLITRSGSCYRSFDAGESWSWIGGVAASDVASMIIDHDGAILVLAGSGLLYRSTDDGITFATHAAINASNVVAVARSGAGELLALTRTGEVFKSTDGGSVWIAAGTIPVPDAAALRNLANELFAVTGTGDTWRSRDAGATWSLVGALSQVHTSALTDDGTMLVAGIAEGAVASSQDGAEWTWQGSVNQLHLAALGVDTPQSSSVPEEAAPRRLALGFPWPNPGSGSGATSFPLLTPTAGETLEILLYDAAGRVVARRTRETMVSPGWSTIVWDPQVPSGVYTVVARLSAGGSAAVKWTMVR